MCLGSDDDAENYEHRALLELSTIRQQHVAACGTKAAHLGELTARGYPVPPGLVVPTSQYERFLCEHALQHVVQACLDESEHADVSRLMELQGELSRAFASASLPADLVTRIRRWTDRFGHATFAVRSSATHEDLPDASFAGQYDSFLRVTSERVPQAITACYASLFNARALLYRRRRKLPTAGAMAVLIQPMVRSDSGGVVVTRAPDRPLSLLIECAPGDPDGIVGGTRAPNRYYLDRVTLEIEEALERHAMDRTRLQLAARQALAIETVFTGSQDVEYAVTGGAVEILQARPARQR